MIFEAQQAQPTPLSAEEAPLRQLERAGGCEGTYFLIGPHDRHNSILLLLLVACCRLSACHRGSVGQSADPSAKKSRSTRRKNKMVASPASPPCPRLGTIARMVPAHVTEGRQERSMRPVVQNVGCDGCQAQNPHNPLCQGLWSKGFRHHPEGACSY